MGNLVNFSKLSAIAKFSSEFSNLGEDYIFTRITSTKGFPENNGPYRIDGISWVLCLEGSMDMTINLEHVPLRPNTLLLTFSDSILELNEVSSETVDCYALFVSRDFIHDINFDVNILSTLPRNRGRFRSSPLIEISPEDAELFRHYFELLHHNTVANHDDIYVRSIARCVIAALFYQLFQVASDKIKALNPAEEEERRPRSRRSVYVDDFINLLHQYHRRERSVSFYASKLFISPKYLSLIMKETTGKSAAELIDEFVILEAKNLLRFSGKNIQQVAYELNFPNQSSFGKYFKHLTGMSPSEYQRT